MNWQKSRMGKLCSKARKSSIENRERHIISPRASMQGADLLRIGIDRKEVEKMFYGKVLMLLGFK